MFIAVLTLLAGALAFWMARYISRAMWRVRHWPTVPGRILERSVGEPMGRGRSYMPHVKYAYTIDGKEYTNDQVYLIRRTGNLADTIRKLVDGLPDPVPVHYNPADPTETYLLMNPRSTFWILVAFGTGVTILGLLELLVVVVK